MMKNMFKWFEHVERSIDFVVKKVNQTEDNHTKIGE